MTIFNKRNALVGYLALQALQRRRWARRRHTMKLVAFVALGIVSAGILAGLLAVALRRNGQAEDLDLEVAELEAELDAVLPETELDVAMPDQLSS